MKILNNYVSNFFDLKVKLNSLDPSSDNLKSLISLQLEILKTILAVEEEIKLKKDILKQFKSNKRQARLLKQEAKDLKEKIRITQEHIEGLHFVIYILKCFGDGIVFKYISKWNLKRFLYEVNSYKIKSDAGFISDKDGLKNEIKLVLDAKKRGIPAILNDITNVMRHGDVSLLGASDPYVIEVKSSDNKNKRVNRQIDAINRLHDYLEKYIGDISGFNPMIRVELDNPEYHFSNFLDDIINQVKTVKYIFSSPEEGLSYIVINLSCDEEMDLNNLFSRFKKPIPFLLNIAKNEDLWANYFPFVLSIQSPENLVDFILGNIFIIVVLDFSIMEELAEKIGYKVDLIFDGEYAFNFVRKKVNDTSFKLLVSEHFFGRIGYELLSLNWFMKEIEQKYCYFEKHHNC